MFQFTLIAYYITKFLSVTYNIPLYPVVNVGKDELNKGELRGLFFPGLFYNPLLRVQVWNLNPAKDFNIIDRCTPLHPSYTAARSFSWFNRPRLIISLEMGALMLHPSYKLRDFSCRMGQAEQTHQHLGLMHTTKLRNLYHFFKRLFIENMNVQFSSLVQFGSRFFTHDKVICLFTHAGQDASTQALDERFGFLARVLL